MRIVLSYSTFLLSQLLSSNTCSHYNCIFNLQYQRVSRVPGISTIQFAVTMGSFITVFVLVNEIHVKTLQTDNISF